LLNIDQNSKQLPNLIKQGLDFARQCNDKSSESRFLCAMASNTANRQAIDESESYFRQAIRLAEEIGDLRLLAVTLANYQVQLFYNIGNYEKALNTSQRIVELTKELNMLEVEIGTLGMMSTIYLEQGNIDHAIDLINMGIDKSKKFSYEGMLWMFDFAHLLSEVYTDFANVNLETIRLHEKESPFIAPYGWIIEAKVLFYRQQYKVALLRLEKLLQNKVIPLGWVQRSRLLLYASYAALKSEYWQRAGEYFGLLEEVFISIKNKKGLAEVKAGQALCYWHLGRKKDAAMVLDELILALNEGLEIAGMIEPFTFIIHVSTLLQEMGEHQQARETLEIGVRELKRRANTLSDETQRQNFLRHSPDVRQLLARLV
jgi:tetratricopeptide (TPR) repeat protein